MTPAVVLQLALLLHGHLLTMHLVRPAEGNLPLIVYATGDGGWRRKDLQTYNQLKSWGYPIIGFSSPEYLKNLGRGVKTISAADLAADYASIIDLAERQIGTSARAPVVLLGVSRGAGLAVAAAGQASIRQRIGGVVAVALTREEEYVAMPDLYGSLPALGTLPLAVVQSTHDNYLPAAEARALFGRDNSHRQFRAVPARNHNFSGARDAMYAAIHASLHWIDDAR